MEILAAPRNAVEPSLVEVSREAVPKQVLAAGRERVVRINGWHPVVEDETRISQSMSVDYQFGGVAESWPRNQACGCVGYCEGNVHLVSCSQIELLLFHRDCGVDGVCSYRGGRFGSHLGPTT